MNGHLNSNTFRWYYFIPIIAVLQWLCLLIVFLKSVPDSIGTFYSPEIKIFFCGTLLGLILYGLCSLLLKLTHGMVVSWFSLLGYLCGVWISPSHTSGIDYSSFPNDHMFHPMLCYGPLASMLSAGLAVTVLLLYEVNRD